MSLGFRLGGPQLGPLAAVSNGLGFQLFGVGTDGLLYRAAFPNGAAPQLKPLPLPPQVAGAAPFTTQALVAARLVSGRVELVVAGAGVVHHASFDYDSPLAPANIEWTQLEGAADTPETEIIRLYISGDATPAIYALAGDSLRIWPSKTSAVMPYTQPVEDLIPVDGDDAVLILESGGRLLLKHAADADGWSRRTWRRRTADVRARLLGAR